jgi:hypothetical protein
MPGVSDRDCHAALAGLLRASSSRSPGASAAEVVLSLLSGIRYAVRRVAVGEDGHSGRVRRHGEHEQGLPRNGRLPSVRSVLTVTVAGGGDPLAHSRFRTVWYQHDLAPSAART